VEPWSVESVIDERTESGSGALIGYLPVGFPDLATSIEAAVALVENGVDALELGMPYSDPVMDGVAIQKATQAALAGGFRVRDVFQAVEEVRSRVDAPVLVMTYWNPVLQYGVERFADTLRDAGGAGLITPDITPDSAAEWIATSERTGLDRVFLAAPSSTDARLAETVAASRGFVYAVSTMGHHRSAIRCRTAAAVHSWPASAMPAGPAPASASASRRRIRSARCSATPTERSSDRRSSPASRTAGVAASPARHPPLAKGK
jgi:tryptophan synthase alpha subunit